MKTIPSFDVSSIYQTMLQQPESGKSLPLIGITANRVDGACNLVPGYFKSVIEAGGQPCILPADLPDAHLGSLLDRLDGILLTGGNDINPLYLGEDPIQALHDITPERDRFEWLLTRLAYDRQLPILGICRGMQLINAVFGGSLYQDMYTQREVETIKHMQQLDRCLPSHTIRVMKDTCLHRLFGTERMAVNSFHHQAVKEVAPGFGVSAVAPDGVIEAIESVVHRDVIGVQWHPESFITNHDRCMMPLFRWLVERSESFSEAKKWHLQHLSLDSHCDTPMFFDEGVDFMTRDPRIKVDLHKMTEGKLDCVTMVAYIPQGPLTTQGRADAVALTERRLGQIQSLAHAHPDWLALADNTTQLWRNKREGKKSILMGIENGYGIGRDLSLIEQYRRAGVVYMTLCHNGNNDICGSARYNDSDIGLTDFGRRVIIEMNRVGMMVDLSHTGPHTVEDVLALSAKPVIASHSSSYTCHAHPRNLTDDQLRAIADTGGVVQVCMYGGFLTGSGVATIDDAMRHLMHMIDVVGVEHVGVGTDFDGDGGVVGCNDASELLHLTQQLLARHFSEEEIALIWGGNFLRVLECVQQGTEPSSLKQLL